MYSLALQFLRSCFSVLNADIGSTADLHSQIGPINHIDPFLGSMVYVTEI